MKELTVYNSNWEYPVIIVLNSKRIIIEPKQHIQIKTDDWFGTENFHAEEIPNHKWIETYAGRYDQNLRLRLEEI